MHVFARDAWTKHNDNLPAQFRKILDSEVSEEDLQKFLATNQEILARAFIHLAGFVEPKFRFGAEFVSDFMVADWRQLWVFTLVEIEPKDVNAFNKDGTPAKRLSQAIKQLSEWSQWIKAHRSYFVERIKPLVENMISDMPSETCVSRYLDYLRDLDHFHTMHVVIIGRRGEKFRKEQQRREALSAFTGNNVEVLSYDWLLDLVGEKPDDQ